MLCGADAHYVGAHLREHSAADNGIVVAISADDGGEAKDALDVDRRDTVRSGTLGSRALLSPLYTSLVITAGTRAMRTYIHA